VNRGDSKDAFQVTLSVGNDLPEGATASFDPQQLSFLQDDIMPQFSVLTITTLDTTPATSSTFTVKATSSETDKAIGTGMISIMDNSSTKLPTESTVIKRSSSSYGTEESSTQSSEFESLTEESADNSNGNFRVTPVSQDIITLDWSTAFEKHGLLVTSYKIERRTMSNDDFVEVANVSPQFLKYSDESLDGNTQYIYRISEMIYDDVLYTSNQVNATTFSFVNKISKLDQNPPSTKNIKFLSDQDKISNDGFGGKIGTYDGTIPAQIMHTGKEQQLEITVSDNAGISAINSVAVNMHFDSMKKGDTFFLYNEDTGNFTVSDPLEIFGNVNVYRTYTKSEMVLDFFFTPQKSVPVTDLIISSWDDRLNSKNAIVTAAFVIQGESLDSKQMDMISKDLHSNKESTFQKYFFDENGNMKSIDAFGNPEDDIVRIIPEPFVYQDYVGKSKRIDDGFDERVTKEKTRAKDVFDNIVRKPLFLESEEESTIKVFIYPERVGHTDRLDADLINELMEKEKIKAEKYTKN
jgi:hypothetical protein